MFELMALLALVVVGLLCVKLVFAVLLWPFRLAFWLLGALLAVLFLPLSLVAVAVGLVVLVPLALVGLPLLVVVALPLLVIGGLVLALGGLLLAI